ncbi:MAG: choice-of-anchor Q domain-containing protein [Rhodanobacteraceae bacterium]
MSNRTHEAPARRRALLALGINAALALGWQAATAAPPAVSNCNSSGTGSLAAAIADPGTGNGATIDLTPLALVCSRITVADIAVHQNNLILQGPGADVLTLDAQNTARLMHHDGTGTLLISGLKLANGWFSSDTKPRGGCLYSTGNISLIDAEVSQCVVHGTSATATALGGGIYTQGDLHLLRSTLTGNQALGDAGVAANGGGAYANRNFTALYSTIHGNTAASTVSPGGTVYGAGAGVSALGNVDIEGSTISANKADVIGGLFLSGGALHTTTIVNSTISGNSAKLKFGGIWNNSALTVSNSTIAFNVSSLGSAEKAAGLYSQRSLSLTSTIIAGNGGKDGANDLDGLPAAMVTGSDNLVFKSSLPLPMMNNTTGVCPQLDALADNGGPTLTHGLKPGSVATEHGSASASLTTDQRLAPRTAGLEVDIGAFEWRLTDRISRIYADGFDGLCDQ